MSLGRGIVPWSEGAVGDEAGRESGDGRAGANSDAAGNMTGAAVGHSRGTQDSEILGRSQGLRLTLSCERRQGQKHEEKSRDKPKRG
jgi:hypothetical protein